ncbi:MAG: site-2 protease family protein [SAR202 cluster bacterium]|nr:site-2 protease family protein [SAR202 cluster bacterium]
MIFNLLDQLAVNPSSALIAFTTFIIAIVISLVIHEFSHAIIANKLGDSTPKYHGRISLNPKSHLDLFGSVMFLIAGFGWAKPVIVDRRNLIIGEYLGMCFVSIAGPLSNIFLALIIAISVKLNFLDPSNFSVAPFEINSNNFIGLFFGTLYFWNLLLASLNLLPLPPLDGFKVIQGLTPKDVALQLDRISNYTWIFLAIVIIADVILQIGILSTVLIPIVILLDNFMGSIIF